MARDRSGPKLKYMMPIYPMIDDRNVTHSSHEVTEVGIWDRAGNLEAWECYLGGKPADQYAAPTRATDLNNLPRRSSTWGRWICSVMRTSTLPCG